GNAGLIHIRESKLAEFRQARHHVAVDRRIHVADCRLPVVFKSGTQEVLFERDLLHHPRRSSRCARYRDLVLRSFVYRIMVDLYQEVSQLASAASSPQGRRTEDRVEKRNDPRAAGDNVDIAIPRKEAGSEKSQVQVIARAAAILRALESEPTGLSL